MQLHTMDDMDDRKVIFIKHVLGPLYFVNLLESFILKLLNIRIILCVIALLSTNTDLAFPNRECSRAMNSSDRDVE